MRLTHTLRLISHPSFDALKKSLRITVQDAPQYLNKIREEKKKVLFEKMNLLNKWYVKVIGLDEVKLYLDRVTSLQEQLLKTQEKRREIGRQLADIRQKSVELQDQIHKVKRSEDIQKFLDLMKEETEILRLESSIARTFQDYDQMERELFTAFSNAIRDSQEKQRAQLEYTKYLGLVLSMLGSFLAFVYTSVKKQDLKTFMEKTLVHENEKLVKDVNRKMDAVVNAVVRSSQNNINRQAEYLIYQPEEVVVDLKKVLIGMCLLYVCIRIVAG